MAQRCEDSSGDGEGTTLLTPSVYNEKQTVALCYVVRQVTAKTFSSSNSQLAHTLGC
jgi:hypothetical protein